jgi:hypothetical protein
MKMIEQVSKKTFVKNVEHIKLQLKNSSLPLNLEIGLRFHLQMLLAITGVQVQTS